MNEHRQSLAQRRLELIERSGAQRSALVAAAAPLTGKVVALDKVVGQVRRHPLMAGLAVGAVALLGSRRIFDFASRAVTLYMLLRR